jgi:hypothetical protein
MMQDTTVPLDLLPARDAATVAEADLIDPAEHDGVFTGLVSGDRDVVGLVAYSLYKQHKYDWLAAFKDQRSRMPDMAEAQSYLLGESTPRRLATYRQLAEAVLAARDPAASGRRAGPARQERSAALSRLRAIFGAGADDRMSTMQIVNLAAVLIGLLAIFYLLYALSPLSR